MKRLVVCGLLVALCAASAGAAQRTAYPGMGSWADAQHGWAWNMRAPGLGDLCEKPWDHSHSEEPQSRTWRLCSTEDGGRTWRTIFVGRPHYQVLRTSADSGIVTSSPFGLPDAFWTRDNGEHWFRVALPGLGDWQRGDVPFAGHGEHLYYARGLGTVHRLTPWPPPGTATCAGAWSRSIFATDADPAGNVCLGPAVDAGTSSEPVLTVPDASLLDLEAVPDGFIAVLQARRVNRSGLVAAVRRGGTNTIRELPEPGGPSATFGRPWSYRLEIEWPSISIVRLYVTPDYQYSAAEDSYEVTWRSSDGGATWRAEQRPGWSLGRGIPMWSSGAVAGVVDGRIVLAGGRATTPRHPRTPKNRWKVVRRAASRFVHAYLPEADRWRRYPDLPVSTTRAAGASTGNAFYVVGGFDRSGVLRRGAFVFREGRWRPLPAAPEPRAAAGAAILGGKLYVVGGIGRRGPARRMLVLDLRSNHWSTMPGPSPRAYLGVAATRGRIVAVGGRRSGLTTTTAIVESWRPGQRGWRRLAPLPEPRSELAVAGHGGRVIVLGGVTSEYRIVLSSVFALDPTAGGWKRLPDLTWPRFAQTAAVLGPRLHVLAGSVPINFDDGSFGPGRPDSVSSGHWSLRVGRP